MEECNLDVVEIKPKDTKGEVSDWDLPLAFTKSYHVENIEGISSIPQTWRMKEKVWRFNIFIHINCVDSMD